MFVCCYNSSVSRTHLATFKKSFLIQNLNNLKPVAYIRQDFLDKVSKIDSLKNYWTKDTAASTLAGLSKFGSESIEITLENFLYKSKKLYLYRFPPLANFPSLYKMVTRKKWLTSLYIKKKIGWGRETTYPKKHYQKLK